MEEKTTNYDYINPEHYHKYGVDTVEIIDKIAGHFLTAQWCKWNAFKYRMRMGEKPGADINTDMEKEKKYLWMYKDYLTRSKNTPVDFTKLSDEEKYYIANMVLLNGAAIQQYLNTLTAATPTEPQITDANSMPSELPLS